MPFLRSSTWSSGCRGPRGSPSLSPSRTPTEVPPQDQRGSGVVPQLPRAAAGPQRSPAQAREANYLMHRGRLQTPMFRLLRNPWRQAGLSRQLTGIPQLAQPLRPVVEMPSTSRRWKAMKKPMIGSRESSDIASVWGHELRLVASMNARKATGTVYELTLLPR